MNRKFVVKLGHIFLYVSFNICFECFDKGFYEIKANTKEFMQ